MRGSLLLALFLGLSMSALRIEFERFIEKHKKDVVDSSPSVEAYDFVFDVASIGELTSGDGWQLHIRNWTQGTRILQREFQGSITSVLGMYNRGKTWFFNRLAGTALGAGMTTHTLGLSFKEPRGFGFNEVKSRVLLLDTAGTMAPVTQTQHTEQNADVDRMEVETYLNEVILDLSVNVIYVVNDLTWPEQQFISSILRVRRQKKNNRLLEPGVDDVLIIVHNWRYQNHDKMEEQFKDFVQLCYPMGERVPLDQETGAFYWSSKLEKKSEESRMETFVIEHFFLASETSGEVEINKQWNDATLQEIRHKITNVPPIIASKKRFVLQEVVDKMNQRLKNYLLLTEEARLESTDLLQLTVKDDAPRLTLKNPGYVLRKKDFRAPLCIPQPQRHTDLELPFAIYMTKKHLVVRIEVPGLSSLDKISFFPKRGKLEVSGEKMTIESIEKDHDIRFIDVSGSHTPTSGSWSTSVPLRSLDDVLGEKDLRINTGKPESVSLKSGVLTFKYQLIAYGESESSGPTTLMSDGLDQEELDMCKTACKKSSESSWSVRGSSCLDIINNKDADKEL